MLKTPSLLKDYAFIYSGDPALRLPDDEKEREHALTVARETGNWSAILSGNEEPTVFHLAPLTGSQFDWLRGEVSRRGLVDVEQAALAVRLALRKVENFGTHKVERAMEDGQRLATTAIIDAIYAEAGGQGRLVIIELFVEILRRADEPLRPKS